MSETANRRQTRSTYTPKNASYADEEKQLTLHRVNDLGWSPSKAAKKLGCALQTVLNWVASKENNKPLHGFSHRPPLCSPPKKRELVEEVEQIKKRGKFMSRAVLANKLQTKVNETQQQANKPPRKISTRYTRDTINKANLNVGNAEVESNAHQVAIDDPRHAASFAALMDHLHSRVPEGLFFNLDKSSFDWLKNKEENEQAVYSGHRVQNFKVPTPKNNRPHGNCSIPVYFVASDSGKIGDVVYLVKDNAMKTDCIDVYPAPVLDPSSGAGTMAYVVFHGKFSPRTDPVLSWVLENVVIPFANQLRSKPSVGANSFVSLTVDGDPKQLHVCTADPMMERLQQARFIVSKSLASCTPIFQPLDAGKVFLAMKSRFYKLRTKPSDFILDRGIAPVLCKGCL